MFNPSLMDPDDVQGYKALLYKEIGAKAVDEYNKLGADYREVSKERNAFLSGRGIEFGSGYYQSKLGELLTLYNQGRAAIRSWETSSLAEADLQVREYGDRVVAARHEREQSGFWNLLSGVGSSIMAAFGVYSSYQSEDKGQDYRVPLSLGVGLTGAAAAYWRYDEYTSRPEGSSIYAGYDSGYGTAPSSALVPVEGRPGMTRYSGFRPFNPIPPINNPFKR